MAKTPTKPTAEQEVRRLKRELVQANSNTKAWYERCGLSDSAMGEQSRKVTTLERELKEQGVKLAESRSIALGYQRENERREAVQRQMKETIASLFHVLELQATGGEVMG